MAIFNSYVKLPEGNHQIWGYHPHDFGQFLDVSQVRTVTGTSTTTTWSAVHPTTRSRQTRAAPTCCATANGGTVAKKKWEHQQQKTG